MFVQTARAMRMSSWARGGVLEEALELLAPPHSHRSPLGAEAPAARERGALR